ncbi:MAG: DUF1573 domain-containing protein [Muribaculaceae bacterium]|nr:DUF1573 domain-containing protein [Muribaculaceae bacterium]
MSKLAKISLLILALLCIEAPRSNAALRWLETDCDFGLWHEEAGPRTMQARFINTGPDDVVIFNVKASCGCTSAKWSDDPIAPGDTAVILITYDPYMRPGRFEKSVTVHTHDGTRQRITIHGNVLGTPESLASLYPVEAGRMRLSDSVLDLGEVEEGRVPNGFLNAYILGPDSVKPIVNTPNSAITVKKSAKAAAPGDLVTFNLFADTRALGEYGPVELPVNFSAGEDSESAIVKVRIFVKPDRNRLLAMQKGKNPRVSADSTPNPLEIKDGHLEGEIELRNDGDAPLAILRVWSKSLAIENIKLPKPIKPGKTGIVKFTAPAATGISRHEISVITNDPDRPIISFTRVINN